MLRAARLAQLADGGWTFAGAGEVKGALAKAASPRHIDNRREDHQ
jgi:hypothetical protein